MEMNPDLFQKLYPVSEDKVVSGTLIEDLDHICNPYEPLLFLSFHQSHDEHDVGVKDAEELKQKLRGVYNFLL